MELADTYSEYMIVSRLDEVNQLCKEGWNVAFISDAKHSTTGKDFIKFVMRKQCYHEPA